MLKKIFPPIAFSCLFLTPLVAIPMSDHEVSNSLISSQLQSPAPKKAQQRRRSSLLPELPQTATLSKADISSESSLQHSENEENLDCSAGMNDSSFIERELDGLAEKSSTARKNFEALVQQINAAHAPFTKTKKVADLSIHYSPEHDLSYSPYTNEDGSNFFSPPLAKHQDHPSLTENTANLSPISSSSVCSASQEEMPHAATSHESEVSHPPSTPPRSPLNHDTSFQQPNEENDALFSSLCTAKEEVILQTYWFTLDQLNKVISFEFQDAKRAFLYRSKIVEETKELITCLEQYQKLIPNSEDQQTLVDDVRFQILLYGSRLAEYEAEAEYAATLLKDDPDSSFTSSKEASAMQQPYTITLQGSLAVSRLAALPYSFNRAGKEHRSFAEEVKDADPEIASLYKMMALFCEARAAELTVTSRDFIASIDQAPRPASTLIDEAIKKYELVTQACSVLLKTFEEDTSEYLETKRYEEEASTRINLLKMELQKRKIADHLLIVSNSNASEDEKFSSHRQLSSLLPTFLTHLQANQKKTPERLQSLWGRFDRTEIDHLISTTTTQLREKFSQLIQGAVETKNSLYELANQAPKSPSSRKSSLTPDDAGITAPSPWRNVISSGEAAKQKIEAILDVGEDPPKVLAQEDLNTLKDLYYYCSIISAMASCFDSQAEADLLFESSKESVGKTKLRFLQQASEKIQKSLDSFNHVAIEKVRIQRPALDNNIVSMPYNLNQSVQKDLRNKQTEIQQALNEAQKPSWYSWFCSFFKIPSWLYFWRTAPVA